MTIPEHHKVYFIGAGPGDPKYLTLEGAAALKECIYVFAMPPYPETFSHLFAGKDVADPFKFDFASIDEVVRNNLVEGSVGFIVPGDMTVFSPFLSLAEWYGERSVIIAGVGVLNAAAALLERTLDMASVSHLVVQTSPKHIDREGDAEELQKLAALGGTMVLYMNNKPLTDLVDELGDSRDPATPVAVLFRIGLPEEKVYRGTIADIAQVVGEDDLFGLRSKEPSMAIIIIGEILTAAPDPGYWNKRKEEFWDGLE